MPASREVLLAHLVRPFPVERLKQALYHVETEAAAITQAVEKMRRRHPASVEAWRFELDRVDVMLELLALRCGEAREEVAQIARGAERDWSVGVDAGLAMLRGVTEESGDA